MNTKSVKLVQVFLISLCAILALMAGVVFSYARAGTHEAMAAVINPNYAQTYIYKHTSTYDTAENKFSDPVSTVVVDEDGDFEYGGQNFEMYSMILCEDTEDE